MGCVTVPACIGMSDDVITSLFDTYTPAGICCLRAASFDGAFVLEGHHCVVDYRLFVVSVWCEVSCGVWFCDFVVFNL